MAACATEWALAKCVGFGRQEKQSTSVASFFDRGVVDGMWLRVCPGGGDIPNRLSEGTVLGP